MGKIVVAPEWSGCSWCSHGGAAPAGAAGAAGRVQDPRPSRAAFPGIEETPRLAPKRRRKKGKRRNDMNVPRGCRGAKKSGNNYFSFVLPLYQSYQSAAHNASLSLTISAVSSAVEIVRKQRNALELYH